MRTRVIKPVKMVKMLDKLIRELSITSFKLGVGSPLEQQIKGFNEGQKQAGKVLNKILSEFVINQ